MCANLASICNNKFKNIILLIFCCFYYFFQNNNYIRINFLHVVRENFPENSQKYEYS